MNPSLFADLVLSYMEEVTAYARRLTRTDWDADDLVQETFERAFRSSRTLRDPATCRAWLFRIARNLSIDRFRADASRPELHLIDSDDTDAASPLLQAEVVERITADSLHAALDALPREQREAVLLCDLWGFRYEEIAEILDVAVGTVRSRISRGRSTLASRLAREGFTSAGTRGRRP